MTTYGALLALLAIVLAWRALSRIRTLERRIDALEAQRLFVSAPSTEPVEPDGTQRPPDEPFRASAAMPAAPEPQQQTQAPAAGPGAGHALFAWMRTNWIYPVAAAALVMAAIYLVQYSIERGLLSPATRIALAVILGATLIAAGEVIRRRWSDEDGSTRFLPSTLSGAGIGALFIAPLAAFHLYGLIGQEATLGALAAVSLLALTLGWVHGPLLAAIGVLAGAAAPFLLGDSSAPKDLLYVYFLAVAVVGLTVDGLRRWGWVALLAILVPGGAIVLIRLAGAGPLGFTGAMTLLPLLAMALPSGALIPRATGPMISATLRRTGRAIPGFDTRAAGVAMLLCTLALALLGEVGLSLPALLALAAVHPLWTRRAPALADLALLPVLAAVGALGWDYLERGAEVTRVLFVAPWLPLALMVLAALAGLAMIWRGEAEAERGPRLFWTFLGVLTPGVLFVALELFWQVQARDATGHWPFAAMWLAAGYTGVALWSARRDAGQGLRLGAATAAALSMIALALMLMFGPTALTVSLGVLMIASAAMDRRFDIPLIAVFQALASVVLGYRFVVDPGMIWAIGAQENGASTIEMLVTQVTVLGAPLVTLWLSAGLGGGIRAWARLLVETGAAGAVPLALVQIQARFLDGLGPHAFFGVEASALIVLAWVQARRASGSARLIAALRRIVTWAFGIAAAVALAIGSTLASPVIGGWLIAPKVVGYPVLNDLVPAYGVPGMLVILLARGPLGGALRALGGLLLAEWIGLAIRHLWQGGASMPLSHGATQGELYTYTVALLVAGAIALGLALRLGRHALRVIGLGLIAVAAGKAFLIDTSELSGLLRVAAFLALGLSLAGLAWLNAWVTARLGAAKGEAGNAD
ncbi:MAG: DUF2339 domain-containing protein [Pararhodobacter sp.]